MCCFGHKNFVDNDHENFYRDCLNTSRLRKYNIKKFKEILDSCKESSKRPNNKEETTFNESLYDKATKELLNKDDTYYIYHKAILPSFSDVFDLIISFNPDANLKINAFSLLNDSSKHKHVEEIIESIGKLYNLDGFLSFLEIYLKENLEGYTERILKACNPCLDNAIKVDHRTINREFVEEMKKISDKMHETEKRNQIIDEIKQFIIKILKKGKGESSW